MEESSKMFKALVMTLLAGPVMYFLKRMYHARTLLIQRQKQGMVRAPASNETQVTDCHGKPVAPGHSFLFGHLLFFKTIMDALPINAHYELAFGDIFRQHFTKEGAFYVDLWPLSGLYLALISPTAAMQAAQTSGISCERPRLLERFFKPIAGGPNLFDLVEAEWRPWRAVFNKGFSTEHVYSLVPGMINTTRIYCNSLRDFAHSGDMFFLDPTTLRYTMDLIGRTILCV